MPFGSLWSDLTEQFKLTHYSRGVDGLRAAMLASIVTSGGAVAQLGARLDGIEEVVGSNPIGSTKFTLYSPERSFTERSGEIVYTFGPKGLCKGCRVFSSKSI